MDSRDYSYDWLRVFSAIMIVLCHICQGFGISTSLGYYLGGTYVCVFLLLSAYLLGEHYRERISTTPWLFLKSRMKRLCPIYYTYLSVAFTVIGLCDLGHLALKQAVGHYLFLNWFIPSTRIYQSPLPQLGHLWFMSCIVWAYLIITLFSLILVFVKRTKFFWLYSTIGWFVCGSLLCSYSRYFIYPSVVLSLFPLVFFKGNIVFPYILRRVPKPILVVILLLCNLGTIVGFQYGLHENPPLVFWAIAINSMLWIAATPIIFNRKHISKAVAFISTISFEIYLVHHPFCLGHYSLTNYMPTLVAVITVFIVSVVLAYLLRLLSNLIIVCISSIYPPIITNHTHHPAMFTKNASDLRNKI